MGGITHGLRTIDVNKVAVLLLLFLIPISSYLAIGTNFITPGTVLLAFLAVPAFTFVPRYPRVIPLLFLFAACVISAPVLLEIAASDHRIDSQAALASTLALVIGALTIVAMLWARTLVGVRAAAIAFSSGMIVQAALNPAAWSVNAWKYAFAFPVTVFALALLYRSNRRWLTVLVLSGLAVFSVLNDYRSYFGFYLIVGVLFLWRWKRDAIVSRGKKVGTLVVFAAVGTAVYAGGIWLGLSGLLGYRNQVVTNQQLQAGGSVLLSGRSESNAAIPLFLARPIGFGPGVVPTTQDMGVGRTGLVAGGADASSTYAYDYLFAGGFKLHSIASDLWVSFGLAGLALAIAIGVVLVLALTRTVSATSPQALMIFVIVVALWDLLFSPIGSNWRELLLALGLVIPARGITHSRDSVGRIDDHVVNDDTEESQQRRDASHRYG